MSCTSHATLADWRAWTKTMAEIRSGASHGPIGVDLNGHWPRRAGAAGGSCGAEKGGLMRRLRAGWQPGDVLLCTDWTLLRLFPPLRAAWAPKGRQAMVPITGANAKRVLFGAINLHTAHRVAL